MTEELREAAKAFYNMTIGDSTVIIRPWTAAKRDAIVAAGERLRAALTAPAPAAQADHIADERNMVAGVVELILRDVCETDPANPDLNDTACSVVV